MLNQTEGAVQASKFMGIALNEGVNKGHMLAFYLACYAAIMLATFVPQTQPFLLNEVLKIDAARQGVLSGKLNFWGEIVIILTVGFWGSMSDRIGRMWVTTLGFVIVAGGILLYGLARDTTDLLLARCIYSAGIAAITTMLITLMADYASDESRGRATGLLGVMNGLGAMTSALVLLRLPAIYQGRGLDAEGAAYATYATMAVVTLAIGLAMYMALRPGVARLNTGHSSVLTQLRQGFTAAREPVIALAYAASFVARGNLAIVGTFFTLWASLYGTSQLGMSSAEAIAKGGAVLTISYVASLLSAPVFGILTDKVSRITALCITLAIGALGYGGTYFLSNPFSVPTMICLVFIGMAEVGCIISSGVLIAEQASEGLRGSIIGVFTLAGAVGILIASIVGGLLFDHWQQTGPFVFFGIISAVVLLWALSLRHRADQRTVPAS
jgi:MFS family permease